MRGDEKRAASPPLGGVPSAPQDSDQGRLLCYLNWFLRRLGHADIPSQGRGRVWDKFGA